MQISFDSFNRYEIPVLTLAEPDFTELAIIKDPATLKICPRLITTSSLTFTAYELLNGSKCHYYDKILKYMLIFAEGFGWFTITDVNEIGDGFCRVKEVTCESYEYLLGRTDANLSADTYKLYGVNEADTLLAHVLTQCPQWTLGTVSSALGNVYRTFDMPDGNIYSFLMNEASEAYECFFLFDTTNFVIDVKTLDDIIKDSQIVLRYQSLLKQVQMQTSSDDIATALKVYGNNDFSIAMVNPLGTPFLYKYDYFKDMMPTSLWTKVEAWQNAVTAAMDDDSTSSYSGILANIAAKNAEILGYQANISELNSYLAGGQRVQSAAQPYTMTTASVTAVTNIKAWINSLSSNDLVALLITAVDYPAIDFDNPPTSIEAYVNNVADADISVAQAEVNIYACEKGIIYLSGLIDDLNDVIDECRITLTAINNQLKLSEYLTPSEIVTLNQYTITREYTNDYVVKLDSYTYAQQVELAKELLEYGKEELSFASVPSYQFTLEAGNFLLNKAYRTYANRLFAVGLGCKVHAEVEDGVWERPLLMELELDFENPDDFKMVFGDKYYKKSNRALFADFFESSSKTSDSFNRNIHGFLEPSRSGILSDMQKFISSALDITKNKIISSTNQEMMWDSSGFWGRRWNEDSGSYDLAQLRITNNKICMTDDNWENCKLAIGEIGLPTGGIGYGLAAELVLGNLICGDSLFISNSSNTFMVDASGATLTNASFTVTDSDSTIRVKIDPNVQWTDGDSTNDNIFEIASSVDSGESWNPKIWADNTGVHIDGSLTTVTTLGDNWTNSSSDISKIIGGGFAQIGGSLIVNGATQNLAFSAGAYSGGTKTPRFYVDYNGKLTATGAYIKGDIYANHIVTNTTIDAPQITGDGIFDTLHGNIITFGSSSSNPAAFMSETQVKIGDALLIEGGYSSSVRIGTTSSGTTFTPYGMEIKSFGVPVFSATSSGVSINGNTFTSSGVTLASGSEINLGGIVTIDSAGLDIAGAQDTVRIYMNPPTAGSGTAEARWAMQSSGKYSLGIYESSRTLKKSIVTIGDECSSIIDDLNPVYFRFKNQSDDSIRSVGFIAEETDLVCKEITAYAGDSPSSVQYSNITALIVAELQRLRKRVLVLELN